MGVLVLGAPLNSAGVSPGWARGFALGWAGGGGGGGVGVGLGGEGRGEGDWRLILAARFSLAGQDSKAGFRFDGV